MMRDFWERHGVSLWVAVLFAFMFIMALLYLGGCSLLRPSQETSTTVSGPVETISNVVQSGLQPSVFIAVAALVIGLLVFLVEMAYWSEPPKELAFRIMNYCIMAIAVIGPAVAVAYALVLNK